MTSISFIGRQVRHKKTTPIKREKTQPTKENKKYTNDRKNSFKRNYFQSKNKGPIKIGKLYPKQIQTLDTTQNI
ncbi:hypothetical protein P3339_05015 [Microbulbifer sp. MLAF003]|uniref:hypothetical protein n=1 Tax=Microbulbifer sp. MLAF003 TaxID=3032582 RepID=UPI0024ADBEE4|nr:hypothetical protein [Microbulbifer sp. MLAF003]WHI52169.1 hypothetical protein P3339_05015 [Microbulbifer sp. MLAF003]